MYYTYILKSKIDNQLYVGYTRNLAERFEDHQEGKVSSTRDRRPFELIYYEACITQKDALKREKYLKTYYGKMFVKKRLKSYFTEQKSNNKDSN